MAAHPAGPEIERLIALLSKLPGLGPRSARRAALALLKRKNELLAPLAGAMSEAAERVRGGLLSALDGVGPEALRVTPLVARAQDDAVREVILALPATVDGQTTAHY